VYLLVDPGFYSLPLNFLNLILTWSIAVYSPIGWTPVTDTTYKETNERTDGRTKRRVSVCPSVRLLDGVRHIHRNACSNVQTYSSAEYCTGWPPKSKPLSLVIIKSYLNHYGKIVHQFRLENEHKNIMSVLTILCVTWFVMSSLAVFEAAIRLKSTHLIKSCLKIRKKEIVETKEIFT